MDPVALYQHYLAFGGDYLLYCEHNEKFVNVYDKPMQIEAVANDATGTLTVSLYTIGN